MKELLLGALAAALNGLLFLGLAWANVSSKTPPRKDDLVLREVFHAAPAPRAEALAEEVPREVPEIAAASSAPPTAVASAEAPAPAAFDLRGALPGIDLGAGGFPSAPAIRADGRGGSPDGVVGGVPGGVPGGTGTAPGAFSIAQVDRGPQRAVAPLPPYPAWARARRLEGVVTLRLVVDAAGAVREAAVEAVEGDDRFGPCALDAVRAWSYQPAILNGKTVPVTLIQRVRFQLVD